MPRLGETVVEGTITRWLKREGEAVNVDEPLVEVSTDKVDSEIPSPAAGTVARIHAGEGETVTVGSVIAEITSAGESLAAKPAAPAGAPKPMPEVERDTAPAAPPAPAPAAAAPAPAPAPMRAAVPPAAAAPPAEAASAAGSDGGDPLRGVLSPVVRRLAAERGIDLTTVRGTGTGGRITKQDVLAASPAAAAAAPAPISIVPPIAASVPAAAPLEAPTTQPEATPSYAAASTGSDEVVQVSHMRKAIAEHMLASSLETARAWNTIEVDMTRIGRLRAQAGPTFKEREGFSLTWMPFVCKAITQALLKYPEVNATWNGDGTITRKHYVNLGIAVALANGLIVPVIKNADGMNLVGIARSIRDLAERARGKRLVPDDVQGGTFTITNPGPFGSIMSVPVINRGQAGIVAMDAVTKRPVVITDAEGNDSIGIRQMVFLSIAWDHRVIDGAEAARYLAELKSLLEKEDFSTDLSAYLSGAR